MSNTYFTNLGFKLIKEIELTEYSVVLVAPFIKHTSLVQLLSNITNTVHITIYTRWRADEIAQGISDTSILDLSYNYQNFEIFLYDSLHAKMYLFDYHTLYIGSANITHSALGFSDTSNLELLSKLQPPPPSLITFLHELHEKSILATNDIRNHVEYEVNTINIPTSYTFNFSRFRSNQVTSSLLPFPIFRFPEDFYQKYSTLHQINNHDLITTIIHDIRLLDIPDDLNELSFNLHVKNKLLNLPIIYDLDYYLSQSRRFGDLSSWLKRKLPDYCYNHKTSQRYLQTIIRWLTHFASDIYYVKPMPYSEVLFKYSYTDTT